ncbi:hypothetical protein [Anaerobacillus sp. 1_MG-2023]|uniref:hypothetical protein n=1 Tax=Anaerobacillus sp. 1_MG-2023 TaxID=3062655 RepID=UPI0026E1BE17|nr:hypothetical protein [Anaerobacillus sp. 1_MG-2023]MDO6657777.1 hypothetical protein [Anaerobacillus sp. 1_MG-2023]
MHEKLTNLRRKMNRTVLKKGELSGTDKERIYHAVIHSNKPKRKIRRFVPAFSLVGCLILLLIFGSYGFTTYIATEQSLEQKDTEQHLSVGNHESENKVVDDQTEFDQRIFENDHYQQIYDYLKEWELPEENRLSGEDTESPLSVKYKNGYSFTKDTGYISSIDWGDRDPEIDDRPLPTENQYMGVVMGYINEKASDMEVELFPPITTRVYDESNNLVTYVNPDGIHAIHDRVIMLMERLELAMQYSNELPALKKEIEKIHEKAETLANESSSVEDDSLGRAEELNQQHAKIVDSLVRLSGVIDRAREDKIE